MTKHFEVERYSPNEEDSNERKEPKFTRPEIFALCCTYLLKSFLDDSSALVTARMLKDQIEGFEYKTGNAIGDALGHRARNSAGLYSKPGVRPRQFPACYCLLYTSPSPRD